MSREAVRGLAVTALSTSCLRRFVSRAVAGIDRPPAAYEMACAARLKELALDTIRDPYLDRRRLGNEHCSLSKIKPRRASRSTGLLSSITCPA